MTHSLAAEARVLTALGRWRGMALQEKEQEGREQVLSAAEEVKLSSREFRSRGMNGGGGEDER